MSLTIHLGAHKTATTHLQRTMRGLLPQLVRAGVHYTDTQHWRGGGGFRMAVALADGPAGARYRGRLRRRLDVIAAEWPAVVISEENILGSLRRDGLMGPENLIYPHAERRLDRLCAMLKRRPATVILAVREPLAFLESAFSMQVQGGHELVFEDYLAGFDPAALSWAGLVERLLSVRGVARVTVWRYEDYPALRPRILAAMAPAAVAAAAPELPPAIVGLSQAAYDDIRARVAADPGADIASLARDAKAAHPRSGGGAPLRLADAATRARCRSAHDDDLARLAGMARVTLMRP